MLTLGIPSNPVMALMIGAMIIQCVQPGPMLLGFIIGPMMEEYLRRALLLSRSDPMVFLQWPISATMLILATVAMAVVLLPSLHKKSEEAFEE